MTEEAFNRAIEAVRKGISQEDGRDYIIALLEEERDTQLMTEEYFKNAKGL